MPRRDNDSQAFWSVAIGLPVLLSVLRLWVEAGGELQATLLLVEHIDPVNLVAALIATATWLVTALFVAALAVGGVLNASGPTGQAFWVARWSAGAATWIKVGSFLLAALTWQLLYLPLLVLAAVAAFQWRVRRWRWPLALAVLAAYGVVIAPVLRDAWEHGSTVRVMTVVLLCGPPLLCLVAAGSLRPWVVRPWAIGTQALAIVLFFVVAVPLLTTPVLPRTVTVIAKPSGNPDAAPIYLSGHVIASDNTFTAILAQRGGITYVGNDRIREQHLCPTDEEIPRYPLRLRLMGTDLAVEHSILRALGRAGRQGTPVHPACRVPAGK